MSNTRDTDTYRDATPADHTALGGLDAAQSCVDLAARVLNVVADGVDVERLGRSADAWRDAADAVRLACRALGRAKWAWCEDRHLGDAETSGLNVVSSRFDYETGRDAYERRVIHALHELRAESDGDQ